MPYLPAAGVHRTLLLTVGLITYGSLYPLQFALPQPSAWHDFLISFGARSGASDIAGNILLFIPFGLLLGLRPARRRWHQVVIVLGLTLVFATVLQVLQIYLPRRVPALIDVVWNLAGAAAGLACARPLAIAMASRGRTPGAEPAALLLLGAWFVSELLPLVPTLDVEALKDSLKPLLLQPYWRPGACLSAGASLLAGLYLLARVFPRQAHLAYTPVILAATLAGGKILVLTQALSVADVSGWMLAAGVWMRLRHCSVTMQTRVLIGALLLGFTVAALEPFTLRAQACTFVWIPFADVLASPILHHLGALAPRLMVYVMVLWLCANRYLLPTALLLAGWVLLLEIVQCRLSGRVATISEPLWVLLLALAVHAGANQRTPARPGLR